MSGIACRLDAFDASERDRYVMLRAAVRTATAEVHELADGYALGLAADPALFRQAAEWITFERRCCPFLTLGLEWAADDRVWLRLTGEPEVKAFLGGVLGRR